MGLSFLKSRSQAISVATVLMVVFGWIDYSNGREWQVLPLYLVPVVIAVWGGGRSLGLVFSFVAAATWLTAEVAAHHVYGHRAMPYWNALMLLMVFLAVALVLAKLHEILDTLDRRVIARTMQLKDEMTKRHQAELGQLRAERLAVVGSMAAQMAHEVRNPMGSISLNMELLSHEISTLRTKDPDSATEAGLLLAQMEQEFMRIDAVIRGYLNFARLPKVMPHRLPLHDFLDEKLALVAAELAAAGVRLVKNYDRHIDSINADPVQLCQVLLNLVRNAREAMPEGGELSVRTHREGDEVHISVSDTGCGIGEGDMPRIFTPFFTTKAEGTGLGLALSQQIVAEHGGRLSCLSSSGAGTTFIISVPLSKSSSQSYTPKIEPSNPLHSESYELHPASSPS